jgi:hypothetical protein
VPGAKGGTCRNSNSAGAGAGTAIVAEPDRPRLACAYAFLRPCMSSYLASRPADAARNFVL